MKDSSEILSFLKNKIIVNIIKSLIILIDFVYFTITKVIQFIIIKNLFNLEEN